MLQTEGMTVVVFTGSCSMWWVISALSLIFWILTHWFGKEQSSSPCLTVAILTGQANYIEKEHLFSKDPAGDTAHDEVFTCPVMVVPGHVQSHLCRGLEESHGK